MELLTQFRDALLDEARLFAAHCATGGDEDFDPEVTYGEIAYAIVESLDSKETASALVSALHAMQAELSAGEFESHFKCMDVFTSFRASASEHFQGLSEDEMRPEGDLHFVDAVVEHALRQGNEREIVAALDGLIGRHAGHISAGFEYEVVTSGRSTVIKDGCFMFNMDAKCIVLRKAKVQFVAALHSPDLANLALPLAF